jgi:hypothetical protein
MIGKMENKIAYREIQKGEEEKACLLVMSCFDEFVAPGYSKEGIIEFSKYVNPAAMQQRLANNHFIILALDGDILAGVIEVRESNHISLFFIRKDYQNKGSGKMLHKLAIDKCLLFRPDTTVVEVNSSPYAVPIYQKLGFVKTNDEQIVNGIKFTPMVYKLS